MVVGVDSLEVEAVEVEGEVAELEGELAELEGVVAEVEGEVAEIAVEFDVELLSSCNILLTIWFLGSLQIQDSQDKVSH